MIRQEIVSAIQSRKGCAVIMAGSDSDEDHIGKLTKALDGYSIPHDVRIASAHKQPETLMNAIREYNAVEGSLVFIAVAGGTDALSGTLSYHSLHPTVSCPPDAPNQSCLTNPPGSSNAYVGKVDNAVRFVAQVYAHANPEIMYKLQLSIREKVSKLEQADLTSQGGRR